MNRHREVGVLENAEVAGVGHRAVHHDPVEPEVFDQPDRLLEHPRPVERVEQIARRGFKAEVKRLFSRNIGQMVGGQCGHGGFAEPELQAGGQHGRRDSGDAAEFGDRFGGSIDR